MGLKFISLFTGIGGFDLGFERAGMQCALQVEQDKYCLSLLNQKWPNVPKLKDVRNVTKESAPTVDLVAGGFPCQDVSVAGRREGLAGERSGLWFEFHRIIADLKPEWVIIENVPGLLSSNGGRDMGTIVGGLAELGYWWAYRVLDAQFFGVPQRRRRVFVVASLTAGRPQEVLFERESSPWDTAPSREAGENIADPVTQSPYADNESQHRKLIAFAPQVGGRTGLNINAELCGTLQENQKMAVAFGGNNTNGSIDVSTALNAHGSKRYDFESETFICATLNSGGNNGGFRTEPGEHLVIANTLSTEEGLRQEIDKSWTVPEVWVEKCLRCTSQRWELDEQLSRKLRTYLSQLSQQGTSQEKSLCYLWKASEGIGILRQALSKIQKMGESTFNEKEPAQQFCGVRRLTPLEEERLQGFPDGFTSGQSDSARYRQLGNAVAVPVAEWIGKRIVKVTE